MNRFKARLTGRGYNHDWDRDPSFRVHLNRDEDYYENLVGGFVPNRTHSARYRYWANLNSRYIHRWLEKQVGRPWDKVWAEICANFDARSPLGRGVRNDVATGRWRNTVDTKTFMDDKGVIRSYDSYRGRDAENIGVQQEYNGNTYVCNSAFGKADGFYVHPVTGILCYRDRIRDWDDKFDIIRTRKSNPRVIELEKGRYEEREVGSRKNRFMAWFYVYEDEKKYRYWNPVSEYSYLQLLESLEKNAWYKEHYKDADEYYERNGYELRDGRWGKWSTGTERTYVNRSCNRKELAWIRDFIAGNGKVKQKHTDSFGRTSIY